jgi:hypothetical protein
MRVDNRIGTEYFSLPRARGGRVGWTLGPDCLFRGKAGLYADSLQDEGRTRNVLLEADRLRIV